MDAKPVEAFLNFLKNDASWFLSTWYAILTKGRRAFDGFDLKKPDTLTGAIRFLFYITVFGFILEVPVAALLKLPYENPAFVASFLLLNCILWLVQGLILHGAMKAFGGKAELQESLAIVCYSSAWFVPIMVLQWPLLRYNVPILAKGEFASSELAETLSLREAITVFIPAVLMTALLVYFFTVLLTVLRTAHQLGYWRARFALLAGIAAIVAVGFFFNLPMYKLLYSAFV